VEGGEETSTLEIQLQQAKQEMENMNDELRRLQQELTEVSVKCKSHETELEGKAKEVKLLKRELVYAWVLWYFLHYNSKLSERCSLQRIEEDDT